MDWALWSESYLLKLANRTPYGREILNLSHPRLRNPLTIVKQSFDPMTIGYLTSTALQSGTGSRLAAE
jgi:hypothetical protein